MQFATNGLPVASAGVILNPVGAPEGITTAALAFNVILVSLFTVAI